MLTGLGFPIVDSPLAVPCHVSFGPTVETLFVRLVVRCVVALVLQTFPFSCTLPFPFLPFPLLLVIASSSVASPSDETFHPLLALTSVLTASMIFGYVSRVPPFSARCCATLALSTPAMTVAASHPEWVFHSSRALPCHCCRETHQEVP